MTAIRLQDSPRARIMIRAANWVGDAIMTTPVVRAVRKNYPEAQITVLAKPWVVPVYAGNPHVDEIMVYEASGRHRKGMGTLRLARDIRKKKFDLAVLMQNAFEAALIVFLGRVKERLGYNTDARAFLLNRCVTMDPALKQRHLIRYYQGILTGAGLEADGVGMDLFVSREDSAHARTFLDDAGLGNDKPVLGINPGATGGTAKRWFPDRYAALCRQLAEAFQTRVLIFGGPADRGLGDKIRSMAPGCCINVAGRTSLGQAFALIQSLDLFVTNDSGLMHAAAALDIPQVTVIGSTHPVATRAFSQRAVMVREPVHCAPCRNSNCPTDHACMDRISVVRVFGACRSLLEGRGIREKEGKDCV